MIVAKLMLAFHLLVGGITKGEFQDGKKIYTIKEINIEQAYKVEVLRYLKTGIFEYDDTLEYSVTKQDKL